MESFAFASFEDEYSTPADHTEAHHLYTLFDRELELCSTATVVALAGCPDVGWTVLEGAARIHRELRRVLRSAAQAYDDAAREKVTAASDRVAESFLDEDAQFTRLAEEALLLVADSARRLARRLADWDVPEIGVIDHSFRRMIELLEPGA